MKKLAMALVCLVSVAFFASCDPTTPIVQNPEPAISVLETEGFIQNGDVLELNQVYDFGFRCASNAETQVELAKLVITIDDAVWCDSVISGTEFVYSDQIYYEDNKEIIGYSEIIATVTDADGKTNKAIIKVDINKEDNLESVPFTWTRNGSNPGEGLAELGLKWEKNLKDEVFAVIEPVEGATLYSVPSEKWNEVTTEAELAALFSDGGSASIIRDYRGVSAWASHEYNDVIATFYEGYYYLIHITKGTVNKGTDIVIEGEWK